MQELEKILEEMREASVFAKNYDGSVAECVTIGAAERILRKHTKNDGWIPVEERLPEDVYTSSELHEKWFLITNPRSEEKLVQRMRCVPSGYVWHDGYDTHRAVAWRYIEPYKPERSVKE